MSAQKIIDFFESQLEPLIQESFFYEHIDAWHSHIFRETFDRDSDTIPQDALHLVFLWHTTIDFAQAEASLPFYPLVTFSEILSVFISVTYSFLFCFPYY